MKKDPTFHELCNRLANIPIQVDLRSFRRSGDEISRVSLKRAPDRELQRLARELQGRAKGGIPPGDRLLIDAFALAAETSRRLLDLDPFPEQILAAIALHRGHIVEMQTGEGKTLAAVFPAFLNALTGRGVHILTANDYLARRDAEWMGPIYRFLGLTVGAVQEKMPAAERKRAYGRDLVYLTAREAGFDFLRDQLATRVDQLRQRPFHMAIVDEADCIMIDEARIPLVIASRAGGTGIDPRRLNRLIRRLRPEIDFKTDEYGRDINLTETGLDRLEAVLRCGNLHAPKNLALLTSLNLALQAERLLRRDIDYIVRNGKIELVDEFTGRIADRRRWPYGLQTALEAKEGLAPQPEGTVRGSITLQHFFQLYPRKAGMTATAQPAAGEFHTFYGLKTVVIPPHRSCIRRDLPDYIFVDKAAKERTLVEEIGGIHAGGRPILVGTGSVEESERLARRLRQNGLSCRVLNAKNDEREARIVARAGAQNAITISTNMAGRGTDIRLGGGRKREYQKVAELGGLYVIGTNRHESRRVDDQLRGRSGRQGDPGGSRFFLSLEDDLMQRFGLKRFIPAALVTKNRDTPVADPLFSREIARVQRIIESQNLEIRKTLWNYSQLVERHRQIVQKEREDMLRDRPADGRLDSRLNRRYRRLAAEVGEATANRARREISLFCIDRFWAEYLAQVADIREGIHLFSLGGQRPLDHFQKMAVTAFETTRRRCREKIVRVFNSAVISAKKIRFDGQGLDDPSSTWTYLINDNPYQDGLQRMLLSGGSQGFAFGAVLFVFQWLPFILGWGIWRRWRRRRSRQRRRTS